MILKTNQTVRKYDVENVRRLLQLVKAGSGPERQQHAKTAQLLDQFAQEMPVAKTLWQSLKEKIVGKSQMVAQDKKIFDPSPIIQYLSVRNGERDHHGIYRVTEQILKQHHNLFMPKHASKSQKDIDFDNGFNSS